MTSRTSRVRSRTTRTTFRSKGTVLAILVLGALGAPRTGGAQGETNTRVHVVRSGETLWRIATEYLGDGHRWREIVAANAEVVSREKFVRVGTRLVIPGARRRRDTVGAATASRTGAPAELPVGAADRSDRNRRNERARPEAPTAPTGAIDESPTSRTVFSRVARPISVGRTASAASERESRAPGGGDALRREQLSAPWFEDGDVAMLGGLVERRIQPPALGRPDRGSHLQLFDRVLVTLPRGTPADTTLRLLAVMFGEPVGAFGRLVTPLGVIRIARPSGDGRTVEGIVSGVFGPIEEGTLLVPLPPASSGDAEGRGSGDRLAVDGRVVAVVGGAALPTLQHVVMLDAGTTRGVRPGDPVTFYPDAAWTGGAAAGAAIARGVVLRVTARGASVLIVRQSQPQLREGVLARIGQPLP